MKNLKTPLHACRYCHFYSPEGRRGGQCSQLGAPVRGGWKACSLMTPSFAPSWEELDCLTPLEGDTFIPSVCVGAAVEPTTVTSIQPYLPKAV